MERRLAACDTVVLFDLATELCLDGALARVGTVRVDMPWVDTELDPWLRGEIEAFREKQLPGIYELVEKYKKEKTVVIFKNREEADEFLFTLH